MAPLVSVLLAAYNRAALLPMAIESVLAQTMGDLELVISDNVSTDGSAEVIQRYAAQDSRVKSFRNTDHVTAVSNFNLCYQRADRSSKYLSVIASDDWWEPTLLERMVAVAEEHPEVTFVHTDMYRTTHDGAIINRYTDLFARLPPPGIHQAVRELFYGNYINIMSALINRKSFEQLALTEALFDAEVHWAPDYLLWLHLLVRGAVAYYIAEPLAYYRKSKDAMTQAANEVPRLQDEITIFRDKLAGLCPPALEPLRREALHQRLVALGFVLLESQRADAARELLREADRLSTRRRLDLTLARVIAALPCAPGWRTRLWQQALATSHALRRAQ